jgi:hypothetical protein
MNMEKGVATAYIPKPTSKTSTKRWYTTNASKKLYIKIKIFCRAVRVTRYAEGYHATCSRAPKPVVVLGIERQTVIVLREMKRGSKEEGYNDDA